jgi:tetrahydromethanopterin S-methyltransferase subunit G
MADIRNFSAIDARFAAVDEKFTPVNQAIGKIEGRVEKLESISNNHSNGLVEHKGSIDRMADDMKNINRTVENILANMNKGIGAVKIINIFFGVVITLIVAWIGLR